MKMRTFTDDWSDEQKEAWHEWLDGRPDAVKAMATRYPPGIYRMRTTGQVGLILSYAEGGTVRLLFPRKWNPQQVLLPDREVFGIDPVSLDEIPSELVDGGGPEPLVGQEEPPCPR